MQVYFTVAYSHCSLPLRSGLDDGHGRQNGLFTAKENGRRQNWMALINREPAQQQNTWRRSHRRKPTSVPVSCVKNIKQTSDVNIAHISCWVSVNQLPESYLHTVSSTLYPRGFCFGLISILPCFAQYITLHNHNYLCASWPYKDSNIVQNSSKHVPRVGPNR